MTIHEMRLELHPPIPAEAEAGTSVHVGVRVTCSAGCDLRGGPVLVTAAGRIVAESRLAEYQDGVCAAPDVVLVMPPDVGPHEWTVEFGGMASAGILHERSSVSAAFSTTPHATSVTAWVPGSQVVVSSPFEVKVGVSCSQGCSLAGQIVEVQDEEGAAIGEGRLGATSWPGTTGLFVAGFGLRAPACEGISQWSASFAPEQSDRLHARAMTPFTFRTNALPEHTVVVKVVEKGSRLAVADVFVHAGWYKAVTDECGVARLELPEGRYELKARRAGYVMPALPLEVGDDAEVSIEGEPVLGTNPDDEKWM